MANILEPIKNTKSLKSLLTNLLHRRPLETTSRAAGWAALVYMVLPDKIVHLTKKSNNILQLHTIISFKMEHISFELHNKMQVMYHLCSVNTTPSKHKYIQPFPVKLHKNVDYNNTFRAFIETKSSMISSK